MRPGPKPRPVGLHAAMGNPSKLPLNQLQAAEPPLPPLDPQAAPPSLSPAAREAWAAVTPWLAAVGVATEADAPLVARLCELGALYRAALADVNARGLTIANPSGREVANPNVAIVRGLAADLLRIESELGLSPAARRALAIGDPAAPDDPLMAFVARRYGPAGGAAGGPSGPNGAGGAGSRPGA
jgi:P27 family predicted phage terminase small subunit